MVHGTGDRRSYQSPDVVLAEARRMAAQIRRQAEREAAMVRRDAAEWASSIRREAEAHARQVAESAGARGGSDAVVDLTTDDEIVDLGAGRPVAATTAPDPWVALQSVLPAPPERRTIEPDPVPDHESAHDVTPQSEVAPDLPPLPSLPSPPVTAGPRPSTTAPEAPVDDTPVVETPAASVPDTRVPDTREPDTRVPDTADGDLDPYEIGRQVALGTWMDEASFAGPARPTGVAAEPLGRRGKGDVIDLGQVVEARRRAEERRVAAAADAESADRREHVPVETSIETRVHDVVRHAVRRTFSRRSS